MPERTDQPEPQDSPTPPPPIPGLKGPSTPETCLREYREAADRRANGRS